MFDNNVVSLPYLLFEDIAVKKRYIEESFDIPEIDKKIKFRVVVATISKQDKWMLEPKENPSPHTETIQMDLSEEFAKLGVSKKDRYYFYIETFEDDNKLPDYYGLLLNYYLEVNNKKAYDDCVGGDYDEKTNTFSRINKHFPDFSKVKQPYKNPNDKRVRELIKNGSEGTNIYDWWSDIQLVKNVSKEKTAHPCPVPEKLIERIVLMTTKEGDIVLDPFMGSGTTGVVCKRLNRRFVGIEKNQEYFEIAKKRIEETVVQLGLEPKKE